MCAPLLAAIPLAASVGTALGTTAAAGGLVIAGTVASAVAAGVQFAGQKQAADSANAFQKHQFEETQRLSQENLMLQYRQIGLRQQEEQAAFSQQVEQIQREGLTAFGQAAVRSGEGGIYGNSVEALMADFRAQQAEAVGNAELNYLMRGRQLQMEARGAQAQADATNARGVPNYVSGPSPLAPILQTAGSAFGLASRYAGANYLADPTTAPDYAPGSYSSAPPWARPSPFFMSRYR